MNEETRCAFNLLVSDENETQLPNGKNINRKEARRILKTTTEKIEANIAAVLGRI